MAARMKGEGVLVANEISRRRTSVLAMNLERMGVTNALVTNVYPDKLAEAWPGLFDAMLVDAPCSGEGTFSRDRHALRDWSLKTVQAYAAKQRHILNQSAPLVRPGGRILYGTCTFSPEENEGVIAAFLGDHSEFELLDLPAVPGLSRGRPEWIGAPDDARRTICGRRGGSGLIRVLVTATSMLCCGAWVSPRRIYLPAGRIRRYPDGSLHSTGEPWGTH